MLQSALGASSDESKLVLYTWSGQLCHSQVAAPRPLSCPASGPPKQAVCTCHHSSTPVSEGSSLDLQACLPGCATRPVWPMRQPGHRQNCSSLQSPPPATAPARCSMTASFCKSSRPTPPRQAPFFPVASCWTLVTQLHRLGAAPPSPAATRAASTAIVMAVQNTILVHLSLLTAKCIVIPRRRHRPAMEKKYVTPALPRMERCVQMLSGMTCPALESLAMTAPLVITQPAPRLMPLQEAADHPPLLTTGPLSAMYSGLVLLYWPRCNMCLGAPATESQHFLGANFAGDCFAVARHLANRHM